MKKGILILITIFSTAITACALPIRQTQVRGSGKQTTETRNVGGFEQVALTGIGNLVILQGNEEGLEISAEDNILPRIVTRVNLATLTIGIEEFVSITPSKPITYTLRVKNLSGIDASGIGEVNVEELTTKNLDLKISGMGNVKIGRLSADGFTAKVSGSGNFNLAGKAANQTVELSGLGNYTAKDLESQIAVVKISGAGNATLWVTQTLEVEISGLGNLSYYGSPSVSQNISGVGKVNSLGEH